MGRELRRVPLDFSWPLRKVWDGFSNPHFKPCPEEEKGLCHAGYTNAGRWFDALCRFIALLGDEAVESRPEWKERHMRSGRIFPHPYLTEWPQAPNVEMPRAENLRIRALENGWEREQAFQEWLRKNPRRVLPLDEEMVQFVTGLAGKAPNPPFGGNIEWDIAEALRKSAGLDENWGVCPVCKGDGMDPAVKEIYEAWEPTPPPTGEGWQLWETVSEGSPLSPVFPTEEKFVEYLIGEGYSEKAARNFCKSGWVPSAVLVNGKMYENIESAGLDKGES